VGRVVDSLGGKNCPSRASNNSMWIARMRITNTMYWSSCLPSGMSIIFCKVLFSYSFKLRKRCELSTERVRWTHTVSLAQYLIYERGPCKLGSQPAAHLIFKLKNFLWHQLAITRRHRDYHIRLPLQPHRGIALLCQVSTCIGVGWR
jgi:hypothetical protein